MFWGLRLDPGKRYSTTVDKSFHVSMAALDCTTLKSDDDVLSVMLEEGESTVPFILCNLQKQKALQCALDLNFLTGDRITFFCKGNGIVHLSGYIVPEDEFGPFESEEGDEEEDEEESIDTSMSSDKGEKKGKLNGVADKRKLKQVGPANKKQTKLEEYSGDDSSESDGDDLNLEEDDDDDDDDDDDEDEEGEEDSDDKQLSLDWDDSDDSDEDSNKDDVEGSDEEREQVPHVTSQQKKEKKKRKKKQSQQPQSQQSTPKPQQQQQKKQKTPNGVLPNAQQGKKDKKGETLNSNVNNKLNKSKTEDSSPQKKTVEGGVQIKDIKVGNGPVCSRGKQATVYYTGRFKNNNKVFDSTTQGSGFKFKVGKGDVIKGWDVGVVGMKVGGKRLITCPPHMAYGQKGSPPTIPGNSTLMFEVELKSVN